MRLYLDAMVWIYAFEGKSALSAPARQLFSRIEASQHTVLVSHFLLAELLVVPIRNDDKFSIARYRHLLAPSPTMEVLSFGMEAALRFAELRAAHRVKSPDAIHLALAASAGADAFITTDDRLNKLSIPGIGLIGDLSMQGL